MFLNPYVYFKNNGKYLTTNTLRFGYFYLNWCCIKYTYESNNSSDISPFGWFKFVLKEFENLNLGNLLNEKLPYLPIQAHSEVSQLLSKT